MSRLIKITNWNGVARANVIFVHGLGGHAYDTWRRAPGNDTFWPLWLATDVPGISVYTIAYEAPTTNWLGTSMPLQDRAVNVLEFLFSEEGLKTGSIVFVCHSLGGLIVKQIMLDLQHQKETRPQAADLLQRVNRIVFAATPLAGGDIGDCTAGSEEGPRTHAERSSRVPTPSRQQPIIRSGEVAKYG